MKILNMRNVLIATVFAVASATAAAAQGTTTQTPPPAPAAKMAPAAKTAPAKTAKVRDPSKPRSAASIECSKQADAKGLHGKERKTFRAACKKDMTKHS